MNGTSSTAGGHNPIDAAWFVARAVKPAEPRFVSALLIFPSEANAEYLVERGKKAGMNLGSAGFDSRATNLK